MVNVGKYTIHGLFGIVFLNPTGGVETHTCIGPAIRGVDKAPEGA